MIKTSMIVAIAITVPLFSSTTVVVPNAQIAFGADEK